MLLSRPKRLSGLPLFDDRSARILTRLEPEVRKMPPLPVHGAHTLVRAESIELGAAYVALLPEALVAGVNSGVVFDSSYVIPGRDHLLENRPQLFAEFLAGDGTTRTLRDNPRLRADRSHPGGVLITGRFSHNYFHFVLDALQAVCLADRVVEGAALITDGRVAPQGRELLELVAPDREIVTVPPGEFWRFDELYVAVTGSFAPDTAELAPLATVETRLLPEVRERLNVAVSQESNDVLFVSRRHYLERNSGRPFVQQRNVVNSLELEQFVESLGGRVIFPEELSGSEQVRAFRAARMVVAPSGSAIANVCFCAPGTTVISLHPNAYVNPWYFAGIASALQLDWHAAVGDAVVGGHDDHIHANYLVALGTLQEALQSSSMGFDRFVS
jgi:capsular polysaccharide biosynthesis protein